jgi:hypothetical protein
MAGLPHLSRNLDLRPWLEHPEERLRIAAQEVSDSVAG